MREFTPVLQQRVWGGELLREWFAGARTALPIGEAWLLSDHPAMRTMDERGLPITGADDPNEWFPVLVKVLHAKSDLSVQVHPDDHLVAQRGDRGKTEGWLILTAEEGARICYGHHYEDGEEMRRAIAEDRLQEGLRYVPVRAGEYYPVPPGTVHALGAGVVALEVQQSSDLTYRLYDYGRLENGKPRALHVAEGIAVVSFPQRVNEGRAGALDALVDVFEHPVAGALLYDRQPYFVFATLEVHGEWHNVAHTCVRSLVVVVLFGDVRMDAVANNGRLFRTWLLAPGEQVRLVGDGMVALIGVPR